MSEPALAAWKLPLIVTAIAVSIVGGFYLGGPGLGMAVGALAAATILVMAVRKPPLQPIRPPLADDSRRHVLVVLASPLEHGETVEALLAMVSPPERGQDEPEILLLAPCSHRFLARWTSDSGPGRERAQRGLVLGVASLAKAGIAARARVGDEDLTQGTEDELRSFPATEVVWVTGPRGEDVAQETAIADLQSRLLVPSRRLCADLDQREVRTRALATQTSHDDTRRGFAKQRQRGRQGPQHHPTGRSRRRSASGR